MVERGCYDNSGTTSEVQQFFSLSTRDIENSKDMAVNSLWLDAFCSSSSENHVKSECGVVLLALDDLAVDGSDRLVALAVGRTESILKIMHGPELQTQIALPLMAVAMCTFHLDDSLPGTNPRLLLHESQSKIETAVQTVRD